MCVCVYVYVECFYSITLAAQRHPLNHLLNPRPSALSPPRSRLMAFENSNIIRRSILSPLRKGTPLEPEDLEVPLDSVPLAKGSVLNLILVGSDSVNKCFYRPP